MMFRISDTVKHLIIINVLFFIASFAFKEPFYDLFAFHFPANDLFKPWQYVTHMFMHGYVYDNSLLQMSLMHIVFNMFGLWMFGSSVEELLGKQKFLFLYFSAGIGAALFSTGIDYLQFYPVYNTLTELGLSSNEIKSILTTGSYPSSLDAHISNVELSKFYGKYHSMAVGASGALYGVMVAFAMLQPKAKMGLLFLPIMIEARVFIPLILAADLFFGVFRIPGDNVGRFAHLGGALFGFIILWFWKRNQFKRWN